MSKDELLEIVAQLQSRKKYGLVWEDKPEDVVEKCKEHLPVLEEVSERAIEKDEEGPVNLLIEGDNYHALSVLNYTHSGKVDVIYIDPPYNHGENDFKYNNNFVDKNDSFRHSKWLSFMSKRLRSSRELLTRNGIIFVSIDDAELAPLKLLMDEVFGENSFLGNLSWVKRTKSTNSGRAKKMIQQKIEYVLVYANLPIDQFNGFKLLYSDSKKKYPHKGKFGKCRFENLEATDYGRKNRDTMKFEILGVKPNRGRRWQIGEARATELVKAGKIELVDGFPKLAVYPSDEDSYSFIPFWSHLDNAKSAEEGKKELSAVIGKDHGFDTVKSLSLMKSIVERFPKDCVVLDYFAGSGTTGHAILELNKEDGGNRQFILCTNNENKIAEEITYSRVKNVIEGYADAKGIPANLRYFKTAFVKQSEVSDDTRRELVKKSTDMICIKEGTFKKLYDNKKFKIYQNNDHFTGILFDLDSIQEFKEKIDSNDLPAHLYVFSLSHDTFDDDFADLSVDHTLCPIPESILEVYRKLFA